MKVALVYDRVNKWGGAERVLLVLHEMFPEAPLYTSVYSPEKAPWARVFPKIYTSFLQKWGWACRHHEWLAPLMPLAFESFDLSGYDLVISVTSEAAKGVITKPPTRHICYCLTPTRYLWSGYENYFGSGIKRWVARPLVEYLWRWDKIAGQRPDVVVGISREVVGRIKKYYKRETRLIYPPVDFIAGPAARSSRPTSSFRVLSELAGGRRDALRSRHPQYKGYFLVVSRLVPYKKVDLAIEAFNKLGLPLVVVGIGSEEGRLKRMARGNIYFVGQLTDSELARYYEKAVALIFPQEEDFGLVAVEAQSLGTPVIAYRGGGALDSVIEGVTGEFFYPQTANALIEVLKGFDKLGYRKDALITNSEKFSKKKFFKAIQEVVTQVQS